MTSLSAARSVDSGVVSKRACGQSRCSVVTGCAASFVPAGAGSQARTGDDDWNVRRQSETT